MSAGLQIGALGVASAAVLAALWNADRGIRSQSRHARLEARRAAAYEAVDWLADSARTLQSWAPDTVSLMARPVDRGTIETQGRAALQAYGSVHARIAFVFGDGPELTAMARAGALMREATDDLGFSLPMAGVRSRDEIYRDWRRAHTDAYNALAEACALGTPRWAYPPDSTNDEPPTARE